jgi:Protein of unknown function (DUF1214)
VESVPGSMDRWNDFDRNLLALGFDPQRTPRTTEEAERYADALRSGEAWSTFCEGLRALGPALVASGFARTDVDLAEGYRYLLGLVTMRLNSTLYAAGPESPAFVRGMDDVLKVGLDNPDGINSFLAEIRDDRTYRIFGVAGTERYVEFVQSGRSGTLSNHYLDEFQVAEDGTFELWLDPNPHPGNHIPLHPGAAALLVRQIQYDWEHERLSEVHIEQPGNTSVPICLSTPGSATVGEELLSLGTLLPNEVEFWFDYTRAFSQAGDNVFGAETPLAMSGINAVRAAPKASYCIEADEALVLEFEPPTGLFWSVAVGDVWFRSIDPSHRQTSLNGHQARVDRDGRCRIVLAPRDPGIANWLDTGGHRRGIMIVRYVRTTTRPPVKSHLLRFEELDDALPASTARVTAQQRAEVLASRERGFARRYARPFTSRWTMR